MVLLTRREQMLVAFVLVSFAAGLGIKQWRSLNGLTAVSTEARP